MTIAPDRLALKRFIRALKKDFRDFYIELENKKARKVFILKRASFHNFYADLGPKITISFFAFLRYSSRIRISSG